MKSTFKSLFLAAALCLMPLLASAELQVLISGGFSGPYQELLPQFERTTGIKVVTGSGASQGTGPQTIKAQLLRGTAADVVILSREGLAELVAIGKIAAKSDVDLARTPLGVAVRTGAAKPNVGTIESFKQALLQTKLVTVPGSTSGIFFQEEILPKLGLVGKVNVFASPRGAGATAMVASGEADMAVMPVSEIVSVPGVELVGVLAEAIQLNQIFAAAITSSAQSAVAAKQLIDFLSSGAAAKAIEKGGMEPLGRGR